MLQEHDPHQAVPIHLLDQILRESRQLADTLQQTDSRESSRLIVPVIERIDLTTGQMTIRMKVGAWLNMIGSAALSGIAPTGDATHPITVPLAIKRRGVETRLIIGASTEPCASVDQVLVRTIAMARAWFEDLKSGAAASINDIAALHYPGKRSQPAAVPRLPGTPHRLGDPCGPSAGRSHRQDPEAASGPAARLEPAIQTSRLRQHVRSRFYRAVFMIVPRHVRGQIGPMPNDDQLLRRPSA